MANRIRNHKSIKAPLTYIIEPSRELKIRSYVDAESNRTGVKKQRIVSDLLMEIIEQKEKNLS